MCSNNVSDLQSPNIVTFPQDAIGRVEMSSYDKNSPFFEMNIKDMHPFGQLHIKLIRTYHRECPEETTGRYFSRISFFFISCRDLSLLYNLCIICMRNESLIFI